MLIFTKEQNEKLLENSTPENRDKDHPPVVRLHALGYDHQWLISEIDPEQPNIAFGLCDLNVGFPELGYVDINEILEAGYIILSNDARFEGKYPLSVYADAAREISKITLDETKLERHNNIRLSKLNP